MSKVLVTKEMLSAIADAVRSKSGSNQKMTLSNMAQAIRNIKTGGGNAKVNVFDDFCKEPIKRVVIKSDTIREGAVDSLVGLNGIEEIIFENVTQINADCGIAYVDTDAKVKPVVIFKKPVVIKTDAFKTSENITFRFEGGITSMASNCMYDVTNVTLEIVGKVPAGKPWGGSSKQVKVKTIAAPEPTTEPEPTPDIPASGATMFKVNVVDPGEGQKIVITCDGIEMTEGSFTAEKGSVITVNLRKVEGYVAGTLSVVGGKEFPDMSYSLVEDMTISATPAVKLQEGRELISSKTIKASSDGKLAGYTLDRLDKCIPDKTAVHFEAKVFCPTDVTLTPEGIVIGDFESGRAWSSKNKYVSATAYETKAVSGGTEYTLGWDEKIDVSKHVWDDDSAKDLLTYYICSEIATTGSGNKSKVTLTFSAYKI